MIDLIASSPALRMVALLVVFVLVMAGAFAGLTGLNRRLAIRGELTRIGAGQGGGETVSLAQRRDTVWQRVVDQVEKSGLSLTDTKDDQVRKLLREAGFASAAAPRVYALIRLALVLFLPLSYVGLSLLAGQELTLLRLYLGCSIAGLAGLLLPSLFVRARADRRREELVHSFPDCLDLLLVCVEAGLGLEAALDRVSREMAASHPLVSALLVGTTLRLRAGASREEALRNLADEAGVDEIRSFATLLIQSDKLGTSIGTTLRVYATEMRERRRMRAEEKAHRLPVLISIPLVTCMLPVMIGTLMLPAAIRVVRSVAPALSGG